MMANKNRYIGKHLTWDEAVDMFPDLWVVFNDCKMSGIDIEEGILVDVIADQDTRRRQCPGQGKSLNITMKE